MVWCEDLRGLASALAEAETRTFVPYVTPACRIAGVIREYLGLAEIAGGVCS